VGNDTTTANPFLKPERLKGIDGGIDIHPLPSVRLGATLFYNRLDDAISNVTLSQSSAGIQRQRRNVDAIRSRGGELEAALSMGNWSFNLAYAYVDARGAEFRSCGTAQWLASGPDAEESSLSQRRVAGR